MLVNKRYINVKMSFLSTDTPSGDVEYSSRSRVENLCELVNCKAPKVDNKTGQALYPELCRSCTLSIVYRLRHGQNDTVEEAKRERSRAILVEPLLAPFCSDSMVLKTRSPRAMFKCALSNCTKSERSASYSNLCTSCAVSWGKARKRGETQQSRWMLRRLHYLE